MVHRSNPGGLFIDPLDWRREALRYGAAMIVVATIFIALAATLRRDHAPEDASDIDTALMIDLPPAMPSSNAASDALDGAPQLAARAAAMAEPRETTDRPEPALTPNAPAQTEMPPPLRDTHARVEPRHEMAPSPKAAPASVATAQDMRAPSGSNAPALDDSAGEDQKRAHVSKHAITQWQRSLMQRLQRVKHAFVQEARWSGTVDIAFEIDDRGALVTERVARSSGSTALDQAASILVKRAAPFPPPPSGAGRDETSFIVPIVFRNGGH